MKIESLKKLVESQTADYCDNPEVAVSDSVHDAIVMAITEEEPAYVPPVSGKAVKYTISHPVEMPNIKKLYYKWQTADEPFYYAHMEIVYRYIQPKIDGVAVELYYRNGSLVSASTRGDGLYGAPVDISAMKNTPLTIPEKREVVVYGDAAISLHEWKKRKLTTPVRAITAGIILKGDNEAARELGMKFHAHSVKFLYEDTTGLDCAGFEIVPTVIKDLLDGQVVDFVNTGSLKGMEALEETLDAPLDGFVLKDHHGKPVKAVKFNKGNKVCEVKKAIVTNTYAGKLSVKLVLEEPIVMENIRITTVNVGVIHASEMYAYKTVVVSVAGGSIATAMPVATAEEKLYAECRYCNGELERTEHYFCTNEGCRSIQRSFISNALVRWGSLIGVRGDVAINRLISVLIANNYPLVPVSLFLIDPDKLKDPARPLLEIMPSRLKGAFNRETLEKILLPDLTPKRYDMVRKLFTQKVIDDSKRIIDEYSTK